MDFTLPRSLMRVDAHGTWASCRKAIDEFFYARGITTRKIFIDSDAFWMRQA